MCDINLDRVSYKYNKHQDDFVIDGISLEIKSGSYVVIAGRNGSGKSTLARLLNALLLPSDGYVFVNGMDTKDQKNLWDIRKSVGMVFQNPENQIVSTVVEEDVAFGPENIGLEPLKIRDRVDWALKKVGLYDYRKTSAQYLSGGQKQRLAIAGILAMKPKCIIFDEATSMLDPQGKKEVLSVAKELNINEKITIINITHDMDEAIDADRLVVLDEGRVIMDDKPGMILSNIKVLNEIGLDLPPIVELFQRLIEAGLEIEAEILSAEMGTKALKILFEKNRS